MMSHHQSDEWGHESVDPSHTGSNASSFRKAVARMNSSTRCRLCLWISSIWLALTVVFMLVGYDTVVDKVAAGQLVLQENGGQKYEAWRQAPVPVYYKVMAFNLTNSAAFMLGARPILRECGPYVYRMMEEKTDITFHDNNTVSYKAKPLYLFEPTLSGGSEDDLVTTVNIPLINAADAVKDHEVLKTIIKLAQQIHGFQTLRKLTVKELLWGYESHVMNWARTLQDVPYPHRRFGLLVGFNNSAQEPYTMYTGGSNPENMNKIYAWNGKTELDFWFGEYCNEIRGTDASGFHPNVQTTDTLNIFNGQLCRSMPLVYEKTVRHSDIDTYRFVYPDGTFSYGKNHSQNQCFCSQNGCPRNGLLDMKPCYWGAAIAFSFPHFYQGDPVLRHIVRGLRPKKELHQTQFDIHPKLGVPLRVKLRMQMNVVLDGNQALQRGRHFDIVFPVFWFEAGIDSLPQDMVGMLKIAQDLPPAVKAVSVVVCASLTAFFLIVLLFSAFAGWCGYSVPSRSPTPENLPAQHWYLKNSQYLHFDGVSGYKPATAFNPSDQFANDGTMLPPYRKHGHVDKDTENIFQDLPVVGDPEPFSVFPEAAKESMPSMISVEVHTSSSDNDFCRVATVFQHPLDEGRRHSSNSLTDEECFSEENLDSIVQSNSIVDEPPVICTVQENDNEVQEGKQPVSLVANNSEVAICKSLEEPAPSSKNSELVLANQVVSGTSSPEVDL